MWSFVGTAFTFTARFVCFSRTRALSSERVLFMSPLAAVRRCGGCVYTGVKLQYVMPTANLLAMAWNHPRNQLATSQHDHASLSAWEEMATRAGYRLLATSHQLTNAIFVDSTLRNVHALSSSSVWCHAGPVDTSGMLERLNSRPRQRFTLDSPSARQMENASAVNLALALRTMEDRCASTSTPYQAIIHL